MKKEYSAVATEASFSCLSVDAMLACGILADLEAVQPLLLILFVILDIASPVRRRFSMAVLLCTPDSNCEHHRPSTDAEAKGSSISSPRNKNKYNWSPQ